MVRNICGLIVADSGFSFGELALINKDCIRNASIITDEMTDLLVVERDLYDRCLKSAQSAELEQKSVSLLAPSLLATAH